jgi:hypothetical protein
MKKLNSLRMKLYKYSYDKGVSENLNMTNEYRTSVIQVQGFRLTQHCLNSCLVFYSLTTTCFGRMTIFK